MSYAVIQTGGKQYKVKAGDILKIEKLEESKPETKIEFKQRLKEINLANYHQDNPFKNSGLALYKWSPIADNLKTLDKEIVLNSIKLKWNLVENEFQKLTKNLYFN